MLGKGGQKHFGTIDDQELSIKRNNTYYIRLLSNAVRFDKELHMGGSSFIDTARNLANIGTITTGTNGTITTGSGGNITAGGYVEANGNLVSTYGYANTSQGYRVGGTQVMDNQRNMQNLGLIKGSYCALDIDTYTVNLYASASGGSISGGWARAYNIESGTGGNNKAHFGAYGNNSDASYAYMCVDTHSTGYNSSDNFRVYGDGSLRIGATTFLDSNRNLTNIGAITASGSFAGTGADNTMLSGTATGRLRVGRSSNQNLDLYVDDNYCKITADQDSDSNGYHAFILNRTFDGTGGSDFIVQNQGTNQFTVNKDGNIYLRSGNNIRPEIYRVGGVFFTWDSDSYGTNIHHSIRSTNGGTWADSITMNSYGHLRFNIDSNNNGSGSTFSVGSNTTGTTNTVFAITETGRVTLTSKSDTEVNLRLQRNSSAGRAQFTLENESGSQLWRVGLTGSGSEDFVFFNGSTNAFYIDRSNNRVSAHSGYQVNGTTVIDASRNLTNINGITATGTGMSQFSTDMSLEDDWENSPISVRERGLVGSAQSANSYAPNVNFHWSGRVSNSLWMDSSGHLNYGPYSSTGVPQDSGTFVTGDVRANVLYDKADTSTYIEMRGDGGGIRVQTSNGYVNIGAGNSSWGHIQTDRASFYFNRRLTVDQGIIQSYDEDLILRRAQSSSHQMTLNTSGATFTGSLTAQGYIVASTTIIDSSGSLGVKNTSGSTGKGLSLYNGAQSGMPTYGISFAGTGTHGTHGAVTGNWATYFTMNASGNDRGWIFRRGTTNVASIDGNGKMTLNSGLDVTGYNSVTAYSCSFANNVATTSFVMGNTTVIDQSRNLTNIGNITAGGSLNLSGNATFKGGRMYRQNSSTGSNTNISMSYGQGGADDVLFDYTRYMDDRYTETACDNESNVTSSSSDYVNVTDAPFAGGRALQFNGYKTFYSDYIPVKGGETLYGEIYQKVVSGTNNKRLYYGIERYDSQKRAITSNSGTTYFVVGGTINTSTSWVKHSSTTVIPTSHTPYNGSDGGQVCYVRIRILMNYSGTSTGTSQFGGWMLKRISHNHGVNYGGSVSTTGSISGNSLSVTGNVHANNGWVKSGSGGFYVSGTQFVDSTRKLINIKGIVNDQVTCDWRSDSNYGFTYHKFTNNTGATQYGSIYRTAGSLVYSTSSDYRLKENVVELGNASERLLQLQPKRFNFIEFPDNTIDGFIAHEVQEVVPEAVVGDKDAVNDDGTPEYQAVDNSKLVPLLTASLQEALAKIETLEQRINTLENGE